MSLCLCLQNESEILIAADSALTQEINEITCRVEKDFQKLRHIGNFLIFMSGCAATATIIFNEFEKRPTSIEKFRSVLLDGCKTYQEAYPELYYSKEKETRDVAALVAEWRDGKAIIHIIQPNDGFKLHTIKAKQGKTLTHAAGFKADEALDLMDVKMRNRENLIHMFNSIFDSLSEVRIGGEQITYVMNNQGVKSFSNRKIIEAQSYPMFKEYLINGSLYGSHISTRENGYPYISLFDTTDAFRAAYSASRYIQIDANNYLSKPYPHLRWYTDGREATIHHAGSAGFIIDAPDVRFTGDIQMQDGGSIWIANASKLELGNSETLQDVIDELSESISVLGG